MPTEYYVVILIYLVACGYFTSKIAEQKGYSRDAWFFAGFFFTIIAIVSIGFYSPWKPEDEDEEEDE